MAGERPDALINQHPTSTCILNTLWHTLDSVVMRRRRGHHSSLLSDSPVSYIQYDTYVLFCRFRMVFIACRALRSTRVEDFLAVPRHLPLRPAQMFVHFPCAAEHFKNRFCGFVVSGGYHEALERLFQEPHEGACARTSDPTRAFALPLLLLLLQLLKAVTVQRFFFFCIFCDIFSS